MKRPRSIVTVLAVAMLALTITAGCKSRRSQSNPAPDSDPTSVQQNSDWPTATSVDRYLNEQAALLAAIDGVDLERIDDEIVMTWPSDELFDLDSAMLKLDAQDKLRQVTDVLAKYPDTGVQIAGHTDNVGTEDYSRKLSERRAISVRNFLTGAGTEASRVKAVGFGTDDPLASNDTEEGRRLNSRIEITIRATEALKARARQ
jgi:outer membrane protein OmpA-like peptidoglycan-associated protein